MSKVIKEEDYEGLEKTHHIFAVKTEGGKREVTNDTYLGFNRKDYMAAIVQFNFSLKEKNSEDEECTEKTYYAGNALYGMKESLEDEGAKITTHCIKVRPIKGFEFENDNCLVIDDPGAPVDEKWINNWLKTCKEEEFKQSIMPVDILAEAKAIEEEVTKAQENR